VLKGRNCTNIFLTVTRWFGGTLLGTGGLVKAYGDSAKAVLNIASFHELVVRRSFSFVVDYDQYQLVKRYVQASEFTNLTEDFGAQVLLSGFVEASAASNLALFVKDLTKGAVVVELGEEVYM
jgi:putative IMPACT (imprinted ancient) family translation regulator